MLSAKLQTRKESKTFQSVAVVVFIGSLQAATQKVVQIS